MTNPDDKKPRKKPRKTDNADTPPIDMRGARAAMERAMAEL